MKIHGNSLQCICNGKIWRFMEIQCKWICKLKHENPWKFKCKWVCSEKCEYFIEIERNEFVVMREEMREIFIENSMQMKFVMGNVKIHWNWVEWICNGKCDEHVV
jgi:hypothetical protein